jgi:hypothetical protein
VFRVAAADPNRHVIIETLLRDGEKSVMAQRYIPEIRDGDKRILLIAGKPVPHCLARIPKPGETRGNLAAGGTGVAKPLTKRDLEIANALGPELARAGLLLVGLDVIGEFLTEINVTSPTCFREITDQTGFNVAGMFLDALEAACKVLDALMIGILIVSHGSFGEALMHSASHVLGKRPQQVSQMGVDCATIPTRSSPGSRAASPAGHGRRGARAHRHARRDAVEHRHPPVETRARRGARRREPADAHPRAHLPRRAARLGRRKGDERRARGRRPPHLRRLQWRKPKLKS